MNKANSMLARAPRVALLRPDVQGSGREQVIEVLRTSTIAYTDVRGCSRSSRAHSGPPRCKPSHGMEEAEAGNLQINPGKDTGTRRSGQPISAGFSRVQPDLGQDLDGRRWRCWVSTLSFAFWCSWKLKLPT